MKTSPPVIHTLAPNIVRVTHNDANGTSHDRPWLKDVLLPLQDEEKKGNAIHFSLQNGLPQAENSQGEIFFCENSAPILGIKKRRPFAYFDIPQVSVNSGVRKITNGIRLTLGVAQGESFHGWGEWFNTFQRKSGKIYLDNRNALFNEQNQLTYSGLPFFISSKGYGFLLLNSHRSQWHISKNRLVIEADGPNADYILIYGPSYKEILRSYTALTGRPPIIPRWGFGLWLTCYPQPAQEHVLDYVATHREKKIPLDAVILDYHWEEHFHNFQWRRSLFPQPEALIQGLKAHGIHLGLIFTSYLNTHNRPVQKWLLNLFGQNVTPGLEKDDERALHEFAEARKSGLLAHEKVLWWFGKGAMLDFTNPDTVEWWHKKLQPLFDTGASFIKNDDGEDLPDDAHAHNGMDGSEYHNIYGFYYGKATFAQKPAPARSIIYARSGWIGSQRFPALFLGDQEANFEGIRRGIRAGLNLALGGFSYWTADMFGLSGKTNPELHTRYVQWSMFSPVARYFFRPAQIDDTRFPWSHNAQVEANFRKYAELRMQLLPYYNTLAHESWATGAPIMRPLMFEFAHDARLHSVEDQIMLGDIIMLCPITQAGTASRKIVLPAGEWFDFWSSKSWHGGDTIEYEAPPEKLPILIRAGKILPMGPVIQNIAGDHIFNDLHWHIWPVCPAEGIFMDDDGYSTAYQHGEYAQSTIQTTRTGTKMDIFLPQVVGKYKGMPEIRHISLHLHTTEKIIHIAIDSAPHEFHRQDGHTVFSFEQNCSKNTTLQLEFEPL